MNVPISARLLACAAFVPPDARVADIGCDHGYLGIYLLRQGIARTVLAADVNQAPLQTAFRNAHKYGVADKMRFFLSDGLKNMPPDFDVLVCAGMGADTIISVLQAAPWLKSKHYGLILQCQSKTPTLRRYLSENGWYIEEEAVLRDGRFLYTVMDVFYKPDRRPLTPGQWYFPPAMLENPGAETAEYYRRTLRSQQRVVNARRENADPTAAIVLAELEALAQDPDLAFLKEELP